MVHEEHQSLYVEYICLTEWDKKNIILQAGETIAYKWVDRKTLLDMGMGELASSRTIAIVKELNI